MLPMTDSPRNRMRKRDLTPLKDEEEKWVAAKGIKEYLLR